MAKNKKVERLARKIAFARVQLETAIDRVLALAEEAAVLLKGNADREE